MCTRIGKIGFAIAFVSLTVVVLDGCVRREGTQARVRIQGSTSVFPFAEMLAEAYRKVRPEIEVDVQAGGSTVGINSARDGLADIGTASRNLRDAELEPVGGEAITVIEIARDGIAVIAHPSNKIKSLTTEQIRNIYANKITNWKEVGGDDAPIAFVTREEGSGTRGAFTKIVMNKVRIDPSGLVHNSNGSVRETIAVDPHAIGYISLALVNERVKAISVDGIAPTHDNLADGKYPVVRPFLFVVKGQPEGEVKNFIDFVLGEEGQKVLKGEGLLSPISK